MAFVFLKRFLLDKFVHVHAILNIIVLAEVIEALQIIIGVSVQVFLTLIVVYLLHYHCSLDLFCLCPQQSFR